MIENWERWEPIPGLCKKYYAEKLVEDYDGLSITLIGNENKSSRLLFQVDQAAFAYMVSYEGFRVDLFSQLVEKYGPGFHGDWTFFKVNNSEYVKWVDKQSGTIATLWSSTVNPIQHFCLITMEEVIDIIVYGEPTITVL